MRRLKPPILIAAAGAAALTGCASAPSQPVAIEHRQAQGQPANIEHRQDSGQGGTVARSRITSGGPAPAQASQGADAPAVVLPERPESYVVEPGDTLFSLTERYKIPLEQMIAANDLTEPYTLYVGQRLDFPQWPTYRVQAGDTVSEIAYAANVDMPSLLLLNYIPDPDNLRVGQVLILPELPDGGLGRAPAPQPQAPRRPGQAAEPAPTPAAPPSPVANTAQATGAASDFEWPLRGSIISDFGPKGQGQRNDGVNIQAPAGTPVRAAGDGQVVYAGNELAGYGELLLVKHDNGWITAYAHNRRLLAAEGDRVGRGQVIAEVGQTGSVSSPQLHFEVREGVDPVDPMAHLPPA